MLVTDKRLPSISSRLKSELGQDASIMTANELGVLKAAPPGLRILVANSPELDYPFSVLPDHVIPCGPIIRAAPSVKDIDPELAEWLTRGPTVYVNLGTHLTATATEAAEMARALREIILLAEGSEHSRLQVLWKLKRKSNEGSSTGMDPKEYPGIWGEIRDVLGPFMYEDRVRITDWVTAEPKSVLESGNIICSVNHGGASSFHEAIW
jgi:hypothetical protein